MQMIEVLLLAVAAAAQTYLIGCCLVNKVDGGGQKKKEKTTGKEGRKWQKSEQIVVWFTPAAAAAVHFLRRYAVRPDLLHPLFWPASSGSSFARRQLSASSRCVVRWNRKAPSPWKRTVVEVDGHGSGG